jgi:FSR family fosmidomycin resistance protein-like MFS transporter
MVAHTKRTMTQVTELPVSVARASEQKLVFGVCAAHFVSHYYMLMLAPLFLFIKDDYNVGYTELGLALTVFNVVSTVLQTPVGFVIDRTGSRRNLIGGLLLGSAAIAVAALVDSFWVFVAMFGVMGLANTVYHPADYTLLSEHVAPHRATEVFSYHTFSGMVGSAAAPATLLFMQSFIGWRGAFLGATVLGLLAALFLVWQGPPPPAYRPHSKPRDAESTGAQTDGWRLLLSPPILLNLFFFVLLAIVVSGLNNFLVVGLGALHGTPPAIGNSALTGLLAMTAVGVLLGGVLARHTSHHNLVAAAGMLVTAGVCLVIGLMDPGALVLVLVVSLGGLTSGMATPSRDMIVRAVTPPGAFGKVFGFVTTGLHLGGMVSPIIFGQLLDRGEPRMVFLVLAGCALVAVCTVGFAMSGRRTD